MTLTDLLDMQRELQTYSENQPRSSQHVHVALVTELGEVLQTLKWGMEPVSKYPAWAWWKRASKPIATRTQVLDELADLLCFVLLNLLLIHDAGADEYARKLNRELVADADYWNEGWVISDEWARHDLLSILDVISNSETKPPALLTGFIDLCRLLGFSQNELEAAYKDAYNKNVARWQAAS